MLKAQIQTNMCLNLKLRSGSQVTSTTRLCEVSHGSWQTCPHNPSGSSLLHSMPPSINLAQFSLWFLHSLVFVLAHNLMPLKFLNIFLYDFGFSIWFQFYCVELPFPTFTCLNDILVQSHKFPVPFNEQHNFILVIKIQSC